MEAAKDAAKDAASAAKGAADKVVAEAKKKL